MMVNARHKLALQTLDTNKCIRCCICCMLVGGDAEAFLASYDQLVTPLVRRSYGVAENTHARKPAKRLN